MKINIDSIDKMKVARDFFRDLGKVYFVGGAIRDLILKQEVKDYDLITPVLPEKVKEYIESKGKRCYMTGARYGTMSCKLDGMMYEITTFRKEVYVSGSRKPKVSYTKFLEEDLRRRDFTINTICCDMDGNVKDLLGGLKDLEAGILKAVGNTKKSVKKRFQEDPLRILRGIRFACKYRLGFDSNTLRRLQTCRWELLNISKERIRDEIEKIFLLDEDEACLGLTLLFTLDTFQVLIPELHMMKDFDQNNPHHDFTLDTHTLFVFRNVKKDPHFGNDAPSLWVALLHDIAKPFTQTLHKDGTRCNYINHEVLGAVMVEDFCIKYKFSNIDRICIVTGVLGHIKPDSWLKVFDDAAKKIGGKNDA